MDGDRPVMLNKELLLRPWIDGVGSRDFAGRLAHVTGRLSVTAGPVLVAEPQPHDFLAAFFGALLAGRPVVLGSFAWGEVEWRQAVEATGPGVIFSSGSQPPGGVSGVGPGPGLGEILIPTGGSSGRLKFARHSWATLTAAATGFQHFFGVTNVNSLCVLPLFHVSGLMQAVRSLVSGGTFVSVDWQQVEKGDLPDIPDAFLSLVPTQLHRLLQRPDDLIKLAGLKAIPLGGAVAAPELLDLAARRNFPLALSYGMTETAGMVTALPPEQFLAGRRDCGGELPHANVRVKEGRIEVTGSSLFGGYIPGTVRPGGWWDTGDRGGISPNGGLVVSGRAGRWIVSGGEKISLEEVEQVVMEATGVRAAFAFGVEDREWGELLAVAYVGGPRVSETILRSWLKGRLMPHKIPKLLFPLEEMPRTSAGKIDRVRLEAICGRSLVRER